MAGMLWAIPPGWQQFPGRMFPCWKKTVLFMKNAKFGLFADKKKF